MEIQSFTPLFEVLCGFNVAFALWDGLGDRIADYIVSRLDIKRRTELLKSRAAIIERMLGDADVVSSVDRNTQQKSGDVFRNVGRMVERWRMSGLVFASFIVLIIAFAGLHPNCDLSQLYPDYELPLVSWPVAIVTGIRFIFVSLASVWGIVIGAVRILL